MKALYFINERESIHNLSQESSTILQKQAILHYIETKQIQVVKLNPYQLHDHYTILHALLYDLKKENSELGCFIYYSEQMIEDFKNTYPAKWLILKSFFKVLINLEEYNKLSKQIII